MPRRQGPLADVMDATALALGLPHWDVAERELISRHLGQALAAIERAAGALRGEPAAEAIVRLARRARLALQAWEQGDDVENRDHQGILSYLRDAAHKLDCAHHWRIAPAYEAGDGARTPAVCRKCGAEAVFDSRLVEVFGEWEKVAERGRETSRLRAEARRSGWR